MRVKLTLDAAITDDAEGKIPLFGPRDATKTITTHDGFTMYEAGKFEVAASGNENLSFGDVGDVRGIYVEANNDFNIKFNGGVEVIAIKRGTSATGVLAKLLMEADITSFNVANPSASDVLKGTYAVWGNP